MFSIFTHVMKPVRDTNSEPGLPLICMQQNFRSDLVSVSFNVFCVIIPLGLVVSIQAPSLHLVQQIDFP